MKRLTVITALGVVLVFFVFGLYLCLTSESLRKEGTDCIDD